jgi:uridine kinase
LDKAEFVSTWNSQEEKEERKILRDREKREYLYRGYMGGIIWCVKHMMSKNREDIAASLLKEAGIDSSKCNEIKLNVMDKKLIEEILKKENHITGKRTNRDYGYDR